MTTNGEVPDNYITPRTEDRYYLDFNSNALHLSGGGAQGVNYNFYSKIQPLILDPNKEYTVEVVSLYYKNLNLGVGIYPILLSDIAENIRIGNTNASVIFKSTAPATDTNYQERYEHNNPVFRLPLSSKILQQVTFQFVRSDTGAFFELDPASSLQITLLIKSVP